MKKAFYFFTLLLLLVSCVAKVSVVDSWRSESFSLVKGKKVLVISRVKNEAIRKRSEGFIVKDLSALGVDAVSAFEKYPYLNVNINRTSEESQEVKNEFLQDQFDVVIVTSPKNKGNHDGTTRLTEQDRMENHATFTNYLEDPDHNKLNESPNRTPGPNGMEETTEHFSEVFEFVTKTYLITPGQEQILASESIEIVDPENVSKILESYSKKIAKQFKKN